MSVLAMGQRVIIYVSDPWEFGTECGVGPFAADVVDVCPESLVLDLKPAIVYRGSHLVTVVVKPRHSPTISEEILSASGLPANFVFLGARISSAADLTAAGMNGIVPAIGSIRTVRK
jgi:hypothetical protein